MSIDPKILPAAPLNISNVSFLHAITAVFYALRLANQNRGHSHVLQMS